jgi:signal transduction histidine kinase
MLAGYPAWLWLLLFVVPVPFVLAGYVYQRRHVPGVLWLVGMLIVSGLYSFSHAVYGFGIRTETSAIAMDYVQFTLLLIASVLWFQFLLAYLGEIENRKRGRTVVLSVIGGLCLLNLSAPVLGHKLVYVGATVSWAGQIPVVEPIPGTLYIAQLLGVFVLGMVGLGLITRVLLTQQQLFSDQALALLFGSVSPYLAAGLDILELEPSPAMPLVPFGFLTLSVGLTYAATKGGLFEVVPATQQIGKDRALEQLTDGIVITATDGTVLEVNTRACQLLALDSVGVLGSPFETIHDDVASPSELPDTIRVDGRVLDTSCSTIESQTGECLGYTLRYSGITQKVRRQQRLEVLHRLIRHNLRNKLTVVGGYTSRLEAANSQGIDSGYVQQVEEAVDDIIALTEKSSTVEQTLDGEPSLAKVDIAALLDELQTKLEAEFPAGTVTHDAPAQLDCLTYREHLWTILWNLAENGLEHNDASQPTVSITVHQDGDAIECIVSDNGPGIPSHEIETIESGTETQLHHASGLGIWLVKWCVEDIDGSLDINSSRKGTDVCLTIPSLAE